MEVLENFKVDIDFKIVLNIQKVFSPKVQHTIAGGGKSKFFPMMKRQFTNYCELSLKREKYTVIQKTSPKLKLYFYFLSFTHHSLLCICTIMYIPAEHV